VVADGLAGEAAAHQLAQAAVRFAIHGHHEDARAHLLGKAAEEQLAAEVLVAGAGQELVGLAAGHHG
jgi:hypothetical protein